MAGNILETRYLNRLKRHAAVEATRRLSRKKGSQFDYGFACGEQAAYATAERLLLEVLKGESDDGKEV